MLLGSGCNCSRDRAKAAEDEVPVAPKAASPEITPPRASAERTVSLFEEGATCSLWEQGLVLDLGADAAESMRGFRLNPEPPAEFEGLLGESFRKLSQTYNDFTFWLPVDLEQFALQAFIFGRESDRVAAFIDGRRLGAARLKEGEARVVEIDGHGKLPRGRHTLRISLSRPRGQTPSADVSWVRLGKPGWRKEDHPATFRQVFSEVTIEGLRHRSIVLQPGAAVRCPLWIPGGARIDTKLGLWGSGAAEAEIAVLEETGERTVLGGQRREKDDFRDFQPAGYKLDAWAGKLVELEFRAHAQGDPARVVFAAPTISMPSGKTERPPRARRAVLIVLGGLAERHAPPLSATHGLPFLNQFAKLAIAYPHYRSSSTSVSSVVASLLTGTPPIHHGVQRPADRLSSRIRTLASVIEAAGGRSAFFTGVPSSFANFGMDRGFERFEMIQPQKDEPTDKPLSDATAWLETALHHEGPVLAVVHLRGGHPPFDVPRDDARHLDPPEYGGDLSPRRAAIQLGDIRARNNARHRRMPDEDWRRLHALQKAALLKQSTALHALVTHLQKLDAFDDTLFIVVGDVAAGEPPNIPFDPNAPLTEEYLESPLFIKFAAQHGRATVRDGRFAPRDISYTISQNLGLTWLSSGDHIDLGDSQATDLARLRPHLAFRDHSYSLRLGRYLLLGTDGERPLLCLPEVDPICTVDRSEQLPVAASALWRTVWSNLSQGATGAHPPERQEPDEDFQNALIVWGVTR